MWRLGVAHPFASRPILRTPPHVCTICAVNRAAKTRNVFRVIQLECHLARRLLGRMAKKNCGLFNRGLLRTFDQEHLHACGLPQFQLQAELVWKRLQN